MCAVIAAMLTLVFFLAFMGITVIIGGPPILVGILYKHVGFWWLFGPALLAFVIGLLKYLGRDRRRNPDDGVGCMVTSGILIAILHGLLWVAMTWPPVQKIGVWLLWNDAQGA